MNWTDSGIYNVFIFEFLFKFSFSIVFNSILKSNKWISVIDENAFALNNELETVIIKSTKITIKENAFYGCKKLTNVIFTSDSIEIANNVFEGCESLKEITISQAYNGNSISIQEKEIKKTQIGNCGTECIYSIDNTKLSFYGKATLTQIDDKLTETQKQQITQIYISSSIALIGNNLFDSMPNVESVTYQGTSEPVCSKSLFKKTKATYADVPI